jgi:23S rRNA A2030 N6-methylase RlmJ
MIVVNELVDIVNDVNPNRQFNYYPGKAANFMK